MDKFLVRPGGGGASAKTTPGGSKGEVHDLCDCIDLCASSDEEQGGAGKGKKRASQASGGGGSKKHCAAARPGGGSASAKTTPASSSPFSPGSSSSSSSLRLLSWNINNITPGSGHYMGRNKLSELLALMGGEGPDVINLQEVKRKASEGMPLLPGYAVVAAALQPTRANGCAIYVRESMLGSVKAIDDFDTAIAGVKQGRLVGVRITGDACATGPVAIFGVYAVNTLSPRTDKKREQERADMDEVLHAAIRREVDTAPGTRIIVAGDLNVTMSFLDKVTHLTSASSLFHLLATHPQLVSAPTSLLVV